MPKARDDDRVLTLKDLIQRTDFQQGFSKEGAELLSKLWVPAEEGYANTSAKKTARHR
jgi:hypothetical protein